MTAAAEYVTRCVSSMIDSMVRGWPVPAGARMMSPGTKNEVKLVPTPVTVAPELDTVSAPAAVVGSIAA